MLEIHVVLFLGYASTCFLTCGAKPRVGNGPLPADPAGTSHLPNLWQH